MGIVVTIGIVTVAVGDSYQRRLPEWAQSVVSLTTQPDDVTIIVDDISSNIEEHVRDLLPRASIVTSNTRWKHHPQILVNEAIENTPTTWICKMDVDDLFLPHALDNVDDSPSDVVCFGITYRGTNMLGGSPTAEQILQRQANLVFSGSPYRRDLWDLNRYRDMIFEDWAFWIGCARQGATFQSSQRIDYVYTYHEEQITRHAQEAYWASVVRSLA